MTPASLAALGRRVAATVAVGLALLCWPAVSPARSNTTLQVFDQEAYDTRVHPAYSSYVRGRDPGPLQSLLREVISQQRPRPEPSRWPGEAKPIDDLVVALAILEGSTSHDGYLNLVRDGKPVLRADAVLGYVRNQVMPILLDVVCLVKVDGNRLELNFWDTSLAGYLYARSPWIKKHFDGFTPKSDQAFELSACGGTGAIQSWFVARFLEELRRVPRPEGRSAAQLEYDALLKMLEQARTRPALRLVIEVC